MSCPRFQKQNKTIANTISRRKFISTLSAASAAIILGTPGFKANAKSSAFLSQVATEDVFSYDRVIIKTAIENMINNLGGLSDLVSTGDSVGIKINMTGGAGTARNFQNSSGLPVRETYWTHPEVLRSIGELLIDAGASNIYVLEAIYDEDSYYHSDFGYKDVVDGFGGTFINLNEIGPFAGDYIQRPVGDSSIVYHTLTQNAVFDNIDCFISLAKSKSHAGGGITHGMKNLVGTLPVINAYSGGQGHRAEIHNVRTNNSSDDDKNSIPDNNIYSNLRRVILDLNNASPLHLVINDAIKTVTGGEGPWLPDDLTPISFNKLIASKDPVAADSVATQVIGYDPMDASTWEFEQGINYLQKASELGMGTYDLSQIEILNSTVTSLEGNRGSLPNNLDIHNYPNPFNMKTTFKISLPQSGFSTIVIRNSMGQKVRTLVRKSLPAGTTKISWDGKNDLGKDVSSGMYYSTLNFNGLQKTHKLAIVK